MIDGAVVSVKDFGAKGDGITDDTVTIQAAVDYVQNEASGGVVFFPTGTYITSAAITHTTGHGVIFRGTGRSSIITNSVAGHTLEFGDDITQINDCGVEYMMVINEVTGKSCIHARKRTNMHIQFNVIQTGATDGVGIYTSDGWGTTITQNTFQGPKGKGIHCERSHNLWIAGNRMDGNATVASVGVFLSGVSAATVTGNVIEGHGGCEIYVDGGCKSITITDNYFEGGGDIGLTFTEDARTIKTAIILNGAVFPAIGSAYPVKGVSVVGNYFNPLSLSSDSSIYLGSVNGFVEDSNVVNVAYIPAGSAFIKTKNNSSYYQNQKVSLGNSYIEGSNDKYIIFESINDSTNTNYHEGTLKTFEMSPNVSPRFDAHVVSGETPATYGVTVSGTPTLTSVLATEKRLGRDCYDVTRDVAGSSEYRGFTIPESSFADYYEGELWVAYFEVKAVTNTPGFIMYVNPGSAGYLPSDGGSALTTNFTPKLIVFTPEAGNDFTFNMRMVGGTGADVVRMTLPIICPLGALPALTGIR